MPTTTTNYSLPLYNSTTDQAETFANYRADINGPSAGSAFNIIDTALGDHDTQIGNLEVKNNIIHVPASYISANYYEASVAEITSYLTGMIIGVVLDTTSAGTVTLNINALGTKSLMKVDETGAYINIEGADLGINRVYLFKYDGTRFIWINSGSAGQIYVEGTPGNFLHVGANNEIEDSSSSPSTFAVTAKGVTNGDSHNHSGGDGAQIDHTTLSNIGTNTHAQIDTKLEEFYAGWIASAVTWTYASATTFTITGDVTAIFRKGTKLKLTQTTAKYFYVISSSYSSPDTTVTITAGSSYTLANAAITSPLYSHGENPEGFPHWFTWNADPQGFSTQPTSTSYKFRISGRHCFLRYYEGVNGVSNATHFTATAPVSAALAGSVAYYAQDNNNVISVACRVVCVGTDITLYTDMSSGAWTPSNGKRAMFDMSYEF